MKKRKRDRELGRPSVVDLQLMFLEAISEEVPEVVENLFTIGNAEEWVRK